MLKVFGNGRENFFPPDLRLDSLSHFNTPTEAPESLNQICVHSKFFFFHNECFHVTALLKNRKEKQKMLPLFHMFFCLNET